MFRFIAAALAAVLAGGVATTAHAVDGAAKAPAATGFSFEFTAIDGRPLPLERYRGHVLLIVNTASRCGYTPQYKGLQSLWTRFQGDGLVVIGVPSNDFGGQEPKSEGEIAGFCQGAFGVTFPLTSKQVVAGPGAHPFYKWAAAQGAPRWNFHKYLVARDGRLVASMASDVEPQSQQLIAAIETELARPVAGIPAR